MQLHTYVIGICNFTLRTARFFSGLRLEENSESHTYPVVVSLKEAMDFDGKATQSVSAISSVVFCYVTVCLIWLFDQDVKMLDLRVFEFSDLGIFQKSAMYFAAWLKSKNIWCQTD